MKKHPPTAPLQVEVLDPTPPSPLSKGAMDASPMGHPSRTEGDTSTRQSRPLGRRPPHTENATDGAPFCPPDELRHRCLPLRPFPGRRAQRTVIPILNGGKGGGDGLPTRTHRMELVAVASRFGNFIPL